MTALTLINTGPSLDAFIAPPSDAIEPSQWPPADEQISALASTGFGHAGFPLPPEWVADVRGMTYHSFTATMRAIRDYLGARTLPDLLVAVGEPLRQHLARASRLRMRGARGMIGPPMRTRLAWRASMVRRRIHDGTSL